MKRNIIIIAGQQFSKSELVDIFDTFASVSPLTDREEAWQIAQAINEMELKAIQQTLINLRVLDTVRTLKSQLDGKRVRKPIDTHIAFDEAEANDLKTSELIRAIAKEVLK